MLPLTLQGVSKAFQRVSVDLCGCQSILETFRVVLRKVGGLQRVSWTFLILQEVTGEPVGFKRFHEGFRRVGAFHLYLFISWASVNIVQTVS